MSNYAGVRITILTQAMITKVENNKNTPNQIRKMTECVCNGCGNQLILNDKIVTKRSNVFKWYHINCAKKVCVI